MTDIEDLTSALSNLAVSEQQRQQHQQQRTFRFSPSSFVAWNYFGCAKQLRLSFEERYKQIHRQNQQNTPSNENNENEVDQDEEEEEEPLFEKLTTKITTQRGFAFEESIIAKLKQQQEKENSSSFCCVIDYDEMPNHPRSDTALDRALRILSDVMEKVASVAAAAANADNHNENNNNDSIIVYVAQATIRASAEVELDLFGNTAATASSSSSSNTNSTRIEFSQMRPDILIFRVDNSSGIDLKIVDIKSSKKMKEGHRMQVATYAIILRDLLLHSAEGRRRVREEIFGGDASKRLTIHEQGEIWLPLSSSSSSSSTTPSHQASIAGGGAAAQHQHHDRNQQQQIQQEETLRCCWAAVSFDLAPAEALVRDFCATVLVPRVLAQNVSPRSRDFPFVMTSVCAGCDFKSKCQVDVVRIHNQIVSNDEEENNNNQQSQNQNETVVEIENSNWWGIAESAEALSNQNENGDEENSTNNNKDVDVVLSSNLSTERMWRVVSKHIALRFNCVVPLVVKSRAVVANNAALLARESLLENQNENNNSNNATCRNNSLPQMKRLEMKMLELTRRNRIFLPALPPQISTRNAREQQQMLNDHRVIAVGVFVVWDTSQSATERVPCRIVTVELQLSLSDRQQQQQQNQNQNQQQEEFILSDSGKCGSGAEALHHFYQNFNQRDQNANKVFIVWDRASANAISPFVQEYVNNNNQNQEEQENVASSIYFIAPRIIVLSDAVDAHVTLPCVGRPDLRDVHRHLLFRNSGNNNNNNNSSSLTLHLPRFHSLNDLGLHDDASFGVRVARCLVQSFEALAQIAIATDTLRKSPASRRRQQQNQHQEETTTENNASPAAAAAATAMGGNLQPTAESLDKFLQIQRQVDPAAANRLRQQQLRQQQNRQQNQQEQQTLEVANLSLRMRRLLSYQASATWLDRGNPATTLFARFVPNSDSPSLCRLEVDLRNNFRNRNQNNNNDNNISSFIDILNKDAVWQSTARMSSALLQKHQRAAWTYCSRDGEFGPFSTAGRWYYTAGSKNGPAEFAVSSPSFAPKGQQRGGSFVDGNFLMGSYAICALENGEALDSALADEQYVFASELDKGDAALKGVVGLCDVAAVEQTNTGDGDGGGVAVYVFFTTFLRLHVNRDYVLVPRVTNANAKKTLTALSEMKNTSQQNQQQNQQQEELSLLLSAALSPEPFLRDTNLAFMSTGNVAPAAPLTDAANAVNTLVGAAPSTGGAAMSLSGEHRAFLRHVDTQATTLLFGPPGGGKTSTLATAILALCLRRSSASNSSQQQQQQLDGAFCHKPINVLVIASTHKALQELHKKLDRNGLAINECFSAHQSATTSTPTTEVSQSIQILQHGAVSVQRISSTEASSSSSKSASPSNVAMTTSVAGGGAAASSSSSTSSTTTFSPLTPAAMMTTTTASPDPTNPSSGALQAVQFPSEAESSTNSETATASAPPPKRGRGRPPGSKNKNTNSASPANTSNNVANANEKYESVGVVAALKRMRADRSNVVLTTVWGAARMPADAFDVLVIDEASQLQLIDALSASTKLRKTNTTNTQNSLRLIVAGDPLQFPPIIPDVLSSGSGTASQNAAWAKSNCCACLRGGGGGAAASSSNSSQFSLITASVFDSLLWTLSRYGANRNVGIGGLPTWERFTDIRAIAHLGAAGGAGAGGGGSGVVSTIFPPSSSSSSTSPSSELQIAGLFQLPQSFRSTEQIVSVVQFLYPRFTVSPVLLERHRLMEQQQSGDGAGGVLRGRLVVSILDENNVNNRNRFSSSNSLDVIETNHIVSSVNAIFAEAPQSSIAIVTPRRHQRLHIRDALQQNNTRTNQQQNQVQENNQQEQQEEDSENNNNNNNNNDENQNRPMVVVDTTERMQGDEADAIILAFADVRNAKFALNLRRINVAISRARRYCELVISRELMEMPRAALEAMERDDEEDAAASGRTKAYIVAAHDLLRHFVEVSSRL